MKLGFRSQAAILAVFLVFLGWMAAGWAGLQQDEAAFLKAIYRPQDCEFPIQLFGTDVALMIASYAGTVKSALYWPVTRVMEPTVLSARMPAILAMAMTGVLLLALWRRMMPAAGVAFAVLIGLLHPSFVLTNTYDWGPVAIQLLLTVLAMHAVAAGRPSLAGLCCGLLLWEKAVSVWLFSGVIGAAVICYPRELWRTVVNVRFLPAAILGALPYLYYNYASQKVVMGGQAKFEFDQIHGKLISFRRMLDGFAIRPLVFRVEWVDGPVVLVAVFGLGLLAWLVRRSRLAAFLWLASAGALAMMMVTRGAGGSVHHHILVWPLLVTAAALSLASVPLPQWAWAVVLVVVAAAEGQLWMAYKKTADEAGPRREWTDASTRAAQALARPGACPGGVYGLDWGFSDNFNGLGAGRLAVQAGADNWWENPLPEAARQGLEANLERPGACFLHWADGDPFFPSQLNAARERLAGRQYIDFPDRLGRPVVRVYGLPAGTL